MKKNHVSFKTYRKVMKLKYYGKLIAVLILAVCVIALPYILSKIEILHTNTCEPTALQNAVTAISIGMYVCGCIYALPYAFIDVRDSARSTYKRDLKHYKNLK